MRGFGDKIINWNQPSRDIFNFVRAICASRSQATSYINGMEIKTDKVRFLPQTHIFKITLGQIIGKTQDGFYVKVLDTVVEVIN